MVVSGLVHLYDEKRGVQGLDLEVRRSECVALLGRNGSGKTTTLQCVAGLLHPSAGMVRIDGVDPLVEPEAIAARRTLAFISDAPVFYRDLTVVEHIELVGAAHGVAETLGRSSWDARKRELLHEFGLSAHAEVRPHQLSAGLRQRAQLACSFARPFGVLLLDEPIVWLDASGQALLSRRIRQAVADGCAVMISTHTADFAHEVTDRFVVLEEGVVIAQGDWEQIESSGAAQRLGMSR